MDLVVISGRSGSGKSTALQLLEDAGYTCVDNLPMPLLPALAEQMAGAQRPRPFAVGLDARNLGGDLSAFPPLREALNAAGVPLQVVYLDAADGVLIKRFSETRRRHPLTDAHTDLTEALAREAAILQPVARLADLTIDTSALSLHELRSLIKTRVVRTEQQQALAVRFLSFGFKYGVPADADFMFDVRCLPNPYWQPELRAKPGLHPAVQDFLGSQAMVMQMLDDITQFAERWIPSYEHANRSYLTLAVGCTGGMHRSVYLVDRLGKHFTERLPNVQIRHRQLEATT